MTLRLYSTISYKFLLETAWDMQPQETEGGGGGGHWKPIYAPEAAVIMMLYCYTEILRCNSLWGHVFCYMQISITHNDANENQFVSTSWTAPPVGTGAVRIGWVHDGYLRIMATWHAIENVKPTSRICIHPKFILANPILYNLTVRVIISYMNGS